MPFINKVTVRGTTYYLENLTDGSNIVKLPKNISANDEFVTRHTISDFTVSPDQFKSLEDEVGAKFVDLQDF